LPNHEYVGACDPYELEFDIANYNEIAIVVGDLPKSDERCF